VVPAGRGAGVEWQGESSAPAVALALRNDAILWTSYIALP